MVEDVLSSVAVILLLVAVWLASAFVGGMIGAAKGRPTLGCVLGLVLGPLGAAITLVISGTLRDCPYCSRFIPKVATVCPHCGQDMPAPRR